MWKGNIEMREIKSVERILLQEIEFWKVGKSKTEFQHLSRILLGKESFDYIVEGPD